MQKETVLWGVKIGDPDYLEEVLYKCKGYVNNEELIAHAKVWAKNNGYDRLRISVIDLAIKPDFVKSITI